MAPLSPHVVELDGPWRHEYLHTRGVRLHAATLGQPDAPLILCIHGAVGGWFDYQSVLAPLADAGFHVAAIDLRGYGLSDKPPVEMGQDIRTLIGDITGAIQALGHDKAVLVGNDTGAGGRGGRRRGDSGAGGGAAAAGARAAHDDGRRGGV